MMVGIDLWLVIGGLGVFGGSLVVSYLLRGRERGPRYDVRGLEEEVVRMKIRIDVMDLGHRGAQRTARFGSVTLEVLRMVVDEPKTARQIQASLGQSREHVARLVKRMAEEGYLERKETRPYRYSITEMGRGELGG